MEEQLLCSNREFLLYRMRRSVANKPRWPSVKPKVIVELFRSVKYTRLYMDVIPLYNPNNDQYGVRSNSRYVILRKDDYSSRRVYTVK